MTSSNTRFEILHSWSKCNQSEKESDDDADDIDDDDDVVGAAAEMEKRKKIARTKIWAKKIAQKTRNSRQSTIRAKTA